MWNLHSRFVLYCNSQIYDGDFTKFCYLLRIYELLLNWWSRLLSRKGRGRHMSWATPLDTPWCTACTLMICDRPSIQATYLLSRTCNVQFSKVNVFWEGHKILWNLRQFVLCTASQIIGGDFAKFYGLLRIYELY